MGKVKSSVIAFVLALLLAPVLVGAAEPQQILLPENVSNIGGVTLGMTLALYWLRSEMQRRVDVEKYYSENLQRYHEAELKKAETREESLSRIIERLMTERGHD